MDNKQLAIKCIELIGGKKNVKSVAHCATRLRFTLLDQKKSDLKEIKNLDGVLDVQVVGAQTQIIIGPNVQNVYKEVRKIVGETSESAGETCEKKNPVDKLLDTVSGIFGPIIPVITAAGMVKAVLAILVLCGLSKQSQEYYIINFISDATFYFFPILLAFSSGNKFGCNPYLAAVIGGVLLHPSFIALVEAGDPVALFGIPIKLYKYASSVLPIILIVWFMSYVEKFADKVSPNFIKAILKPLLIVAITAPIALSAIGPIGAFLGDLLAAGVNFLDTNIPFLVPTLMGTFCPLLVFVGMHTTLTPLASLSLADKGFETIQGPGMLASNIAQGSASLAVALKTKNPKVKQLAFSASATALCGITEPALYGVTFKFKKPLIAVMIGGGVAGLYAGITRLVRFSFGSPGFATLPVFIGEDPSNFKNALITVAISFIVTFVLTWIIGFEDEIDENNKESNKEEFNQQKINLNNQTVEIITPLQGRVVPLSEVNDPTFASGAVGQGVAILPTDNNIYSPVNGEVVTVFNSKHAIGINGENGEEILIHLGINTVELEGKYFDIKVKDGEKITKGQLLGTFDREKIKKAGYEIISPILITNSKLFLEVIPTKNELVGKDDKLITLI
ncbi:beta-glucoside-specific PTS transporter subunit IIABC [Clostridium nigeriense]|uniref:beta-glucoside-specific PTS transporter subunit IIABC n=1 Tax=Clostridium nigeriense TaxID=1805470 RepID=UPI003D33CBE2